MNAVSKQSRKLFDALNAHLGQNPFVGDIRGRGLFVGVELVKDRGLKKPFDPSLRLAAKIKRKAFDHGLICYPMSGTRDGEFGDHILLAPPFTISDGQISELVEKTVKALSSVLPT